MKIRFAVLVVLFLLSLSSCSNAGDIDGALNKAKTEGKIVMLVAIACAVFSTS